MNWLDWLGEGQYRRVKVEGAEGPLGPAGPDQVLQLVREGA